MADQTLRSASKTEFAVYGRPAHEEIRTGCLQRIADASERMASNYTALQREAADYKRWYEEQKAYAAKLQRRLSAAKGQITKLRKRLT